MLRVGLTSGKSRETQEKQVKTERMLTFTSSMPKALPPMIGQKTTEKHRLHTSASIPTTILPTNSCGRYTLGRSGRERTALGMSIFINVPQQQPLPTPRPRHHRKTALSPRIGRLTQQAWTPPICMSGFAIVRRHTALGEHSSALPLTAPRRLYGRSMERKERQAQQETILRCALPRTAAQPHRHR